MRLEISLKEITEFLNNYYHIHIPLKSVDENKIEVHYLFSFTISVQEVREDAVVFEYDSGGLADLIAKGIHAFQKDKFEDSFIDWDSEAKQVIIDLKKISKAREFLKYLKLSDLRFDDENILINIISRE